MHLTYVNILCATRAPQIRKWERHSFLMDKKSHAEIGSKTARDVRRVFNCLPYLGSQLPLLSVLLRLVVFWLFSDGTSCRVPQSAPPPNCSGRNSVGRGTPC